MGPLEIERANTAYEQFAVMKAALFLDSAFLRKDLLSTAELAGAHKLLGATNAVLGHSLEAIDHFTQALRLDEYTSLDPGKFSAVELEAFNVARSQWIAGMRPDSSAAVMQRLQLGMLRIGTPAPNATFLVRAPGIAR